MPEIKACKARSPFMHAKKERKNAHPVPTKAFLQLNLCMAILFSPFG